LQLESDSPEQSAGVQRGGWRDSRRPYAVVALVVLVLLSFQTLNRDWSTDYWMYTATLGALRADVRNPQHDMTGTDDPSERFTPYTVGLAAIGRETGLASVTLLELAAFANLVLFLVAFELFVTELTGRRLVACFALIATLVMWGLDPWRWSGFLNLNSIGFGLPWPSTFVTGLGLIAGWALLRFDKSGSSGWLVIVGVAMAVGAVSHPYTAGWISVMLLALVVHRRLYRRDRVIPLLVMTACTAGLVVAWPYYPFLELGSRGDAAYSGVMNVMYRSVALRTVAALPGFFVVFQRFRRDHTDALALMLFGGLGIYLVGAVSDQQSFGRVLPLIMLAAQIGIGLLVADLVERRRPATVPMVTWLAVSFAIGLVGVAPGVVRTVPRSVLPQSLRERPALQSVTTQWSALANVVEPGTVVIAQRNLGLSSVAPAFGMSVVFPGYPSAFVKDIKTRDRDVATFLAASTTDEVRREIAARYGAEAVLCASNGCVREFASGDVIARGPNWTLIRLRLS
jgi:hypothetical protein